MGARVWTLDQAQDGFRARPNAKTAERYIATVREYLRDEMIGQATYDAALAEIAAREGEPPKPAQRWTAGPLTVEPDETKIGYFLIRSGGDVIAETYANSDAQAEADAHLFAGAGGMAGALRDALTWWHSDTRRMMQREPTWLEDARAALKKAGAL